MRKCPNCNNELTNLCDIFYNGQPIHNRVKCGNCEYEENGMFVVNNGKNVEK